MPFLKVKNRASSILTSNISETDTTLTVQDASKFPSEPPFHITIDDEILEVTAINGNTFTVTRGAEETTPAPHSAGAKVELRITAQIIEEIQEKLPLDLGQPGQFLKSQGEGKNPVWEDFLFEYTFVPSDNVRHANDNNKTINSIYIYKLKEIKLNENLPAVRIKFSIYNNDSAITAYAQIYKNNSPIGTLRSISGAGSQTFTEDFTNFVKGDLIQLYGYRSNNYGTQYVFNFRLCFDRKIKRIHNSLEILTDVFVAPFINPPENTLV